MTDNPTEAGWYDDPERKGMERYWNGSEWSGAPRERQGRMQTSTALWMIVGTVVVAGAVAVFYFALFT